MKEKIKQAAQAYYPKGTLYEVYKVSGFVRGANWGIKAILDEVYNRLDDIDFDTEYWNFEDGFCKEQFINDLKNTISKIL